MKYVKVLLAVFAAVSLLSTPCRAGTKVIKDNDQREWIVDEATAGTPGAGAGLGAIVGAVADTLPAYQRNAFDLQVGISGSGVAADDSMDTETAITSATVFWRPNSWFRIGPQFAMSVKDTEVFSLGIPMGFKLAPDPFSKYILWLGVDVLPKFTVRTGEEPDTRKSAFSWTPGIALRAEVPLGLLSVEGGVGTSYLAALEGVTDPAENPAVSNVQFSGDVAFNFRLR